MTNQNGEKPCLYGLQLNSKLCVCQFEHSAGACFAGEYIIYRRVEQNKKNWPHFLLILFVSLPSLLMIFPYFIMTTEHFFPTRTQLPPLLPPNSLDSFFQFSFSVLDFR